jgi:uncharacterized protein
MRTVIALLHDVATLLRPWPARALAIAAALQVLYWHLGSPGPFLAGEPRSLGAALTTVAWSVTLLLAVPLVVLVARRDVARSLPLGLGDWRFALPATIVLGAAATVIMWFAAQGPDIQAHYPLPGAWAGTSALHLLAWAGLYTLFYVAYEAFYRGFLLRAVEPAWGLEAAIWTQAVASTLIHVGKPLPEALAALPFGLLAGALAVRGRSLLWPILLHLVLGLSTDVFSLLHQGRLLP